MRRCNDTDIGDDRPALYLVGLVMDAMDALGDLMEQAEDMNKEDLVDEITNIQANLQIADAMCADVHPKEYHEYITGGRNEN